MCDNKCVYETTNVKYSYFFFIDYSYLSLNFSPNFPIYRHCIPITPLISTICCISGPVGGTGIGGPQGIAGFQGLAGVKGRLGRPGPGGLNGQQGLPGVGGMQGEPGPDGGRGPTGPDGKKRLYI